MYADHLLGASPVSVLLVLALLAILVLYHLASLYGATVAYPQFPLAALLEKGLRPGASYQKYGTETVQHGANTYPGCFQVMAATGPRLIVPNRFADELKNNKNLGFDEAFDKDYFPDYPGFEPVKEVLKDGHLLSETIRGRLTQSLDLVLDGMVQETEKSTSEIFGRESDWHSIALKQNVQELIARLTSLVFLGERFSRNRRWLDISKNYTVDTLIAAYSMRAVPAFIRPIAHWFLPPNIRIRKAYRDACQMLLPEIELCQKRTDEAMKAGAKSLRAADTIGWMYELARGRDVDYAAAQLSLSLASVHTTSETISQTILDLCVHPEVVQPLRDEVETIVAQEGWTKASLSKMKLLDSFLKESMRTSPLFMTSMRRFVKAPVQLSDGTVLPKSARIMVMTRFSDPTLYPDPEVFKADRFLRLREQTGQSNAWQHVTTSSEHLGFGYGQNSCPGRFLASNLMKVVVGHLLLEYELKLPSEGSPPRVEYDGSIAMDPNVHIVIRRRKEGDSINV